MTRYVYDFAEGADLGRELLGGKGAGLAEMTTLGIPVPAGFTVTTQACVEYMRAGKELPAGLGDEVEEHLARLEETTDKRLGDRGDPLLVSVRSGAAVSMPGMMDTSQNLGLTDEAVEGRAATTPNARFATDAYRRQLQMDGEVVDGVSAQLLVEEMTAINETRGVRMDVDLSAEDLKEHVGRFMEI
jgi:pyruvate,orthophosphate dikinase